jgi:hypothetical protein
MIFVFTERIAVAINAAEKVLNTDSWPSSFEWIKWLRQIEDLSQTKNTIQIRVTFWDDGDPERPKAVIVDLLQDDDGSWLPTTASIYSVTETPQKKLYGFTALGKPDRKS